eukprot:TRINITY_DN8762_c0_g1_i1.p1 TRINITY_DN8762_c0_g1~~TRINITY_DN8762_c0_g1_i1.p1  ORF type:complete len:209 (-),score=47.57 TRINITY_DN8762_c0_g1_i1:145-771(-)
MLRDFSFSGPLTELKELYLVKNKVSVIGEELTGMTQLRLLELGDNRIRAIENLSSCQALDSLWLAKNKISCLQGLGSLSNLRVLSMQCNRLTKIEGLEGLTGLQELYLSNNGITVMEGLSSLGQLRTLDLAANRICSLGDMSQLVQLEDFWFNGNPWKELKELEGLGGLTQLTTVYFYDTPAQGGAGTTYQTRVQAMIPSVKFIDTCN